MSYWNIIVNTGDILTKKETLMLLNLTKNNKVNFYITFNEILLDFIISNIFYLSK